MPTCIITNRMDLVTAQELKTNSMTAQTGRREAVNGHIWLPRIDLSESVCREVKLNTGIYRKPLTGPFPLSLQCFSVAWCSPRGPLLLSLNMIHGAVPSLSLINNETNSEQKTLRYNLQLGYLSHYYCEGEKHILNIFKVIWMIERCPNQHGEDSILMNADLL